MPGKYKLISVPWINYGTEEMESVRKSVSVQLILMDYIAKNSVWEGRINTVVSKIKNQLVYGKYYRNRG